MLVACVSMSPANSESGESQAYDKEDLFVAGFVCKAFSSYSNERFTHESVAQMFESDSHLAPWI